MCRVALLTGVTGFIGYRLAIKLAEAGWQVHCLVRRQSSPEKIQKCLEYKFKIHILDERNGNIEKIVEAVQPTIVFHLASLFLAQHQSGDIRALINSNITFGTQLLEAMVRHNVQYFINTGTCWQHDQDGDYNPVCLYAATKQAFMDIIKFYQQTTALKVITLKLFDTYGLGDERPKLFALLKRLYETDEELLMSPGEQYIDIVHVDDAVRAYLLAAEYLFTGKEEYIGEYAISSEQKIKLRDLIALFEKVAGKKLNILWGGRPYRDREPMLPWGTGRKLPGWHARISLTEGIQEILFGTRRCNRNGR